MVNPRFWSLVTLLGALTATACGSSSTTSTAPATVPQCGVTLGASDMSVPASGGNGRVTVSAARECEAAADRAPQRSEQPIAQRPKQKERQPVEQPDAV